VLLQRQHPLASRRRYLRRLPAAQSALSAPRGHQRQHRGGRSGLARARDAGGHERRTALPRAAPRQALPTHSRERRDGKLFKFTAACGPWIYRGDLLPELYGNAFVAEPVGNLVQRKVLTPENGSIVGRNPYRQADFIASTDERFRPVNFSTGPDGALYVVDMYRGIV